MKSYLAHIVLTAGLALAAIAPVQAFAPADAAEMQAILKRIVAPTFPNRDFRVVDFGAVGDGKTDCRAAIARAIAACTKAGGGRVVVPAGVFFCDGPIHLASNVNLHLDEGATIKFGVDPERYLPPVLTRFEGTMLYGHSPRIYADGATNIAITGRGTLDGNGRATLDLMKHSTARGSSGVLRKMGATGVPVAERVFGAGKWMRPSMLQPFECTNVLIEGVTVRDSTFWCIHPVLCRNVTVRDVTVDSWNGNNDGCDPDSSRDVLIEDCTFHTGDDSIAIKSGRDQDGWRVGAPAENIVIRRVRMDSRHGGICIGSEMSGGVRNIFVEDCRGESLSNGLYFKANLDRGGGVEHVRVDGLHVARVRDALVRFSTSYPGYRGENHPPTFRDFVLENLSCGQSTGYAVFLEGVPAAPIRDVTLRHVEVASARAATWLRHTEGVRFEDVRVNGRPVTPAPATGRKLKIGS